MTAHDTLNLFHPSMPLVRAVIGGVLLVGLGLMGGGVGGADVEGPTVDPGERPAAYTSHYLVFGTRDASGTPRLLAIDFNRTRHGADRVSYEYKLFVAQGGDWSMPVYETWEQAPSEASFPARGGLTPVLGRDGTLRAVRVKRGDLRLEVRPDESSFPFPTNAPESDNRTGHPTFTVAWNGTTYEGPGVYEWIESDGATAGENPERERQLDDDATFGLYDWIVLYDERGRLWHVSQGTLTSDFAYQQAVPSLPSQTRDVMVRWTATTPDSLAGLHTPRRWLVDVPAWEMRVSLRKTGEHRGHGGERADGTRPIYVQATAVGPGIVQGEEQQFFGMVEHIRD